MNRKPTWHKKANPETEAFTGRNAKKGQPNRKQLKRLEVRMADYAVMVNAREHHNGPSKRLAGGGYHRPGSMQ